VRGFEQIPWLYDALFSVIERNGLGRWRKALTSGARGLTLDLGCGTGRNLPLFDGAVRAVVALDPCADTLRKAIRRSPQALFVRASAEALPFRDGTFDTVVSGLVFCSVPQPAVGLAEVRRALKPDGKLRMLEHVRATAPWKGRVQDFIQPAWTWVAGGCHPNRDTERAVEQAGFAIEDGRRAQDDFRLFSAKKK
jgi:ubiquinone/menaquinone biosynthesis C-methylase UbiE